VAIPLTSESAPAALIDGDQTVIVELREGDPELVAWGARPRTPRSRKYGRGGAGQEGRAGPVPLHCLRLRHRRLRSISELPDVWRDTLGAC
jgi:hypothetical protein